MRKLFSARNSNAVLIALIFAPSMMSSAATAESHIDRTLSRWMVEATIKPGAEQVLKERLHLANAADQKRREDGIQEGLAFVAADRSKAWIIIRAENESALLALFKTMPLNDYQSYSWIQILNEADN